MRTVPAVVAAAGILAVATAASGQTRELTTIFASNNQFAGNMFDLDVRSNVSIERLAVNLTAPGSTNSIELYIREGTSFGFENTASGWTLAARDDGVISAGQDQPSFVEIRGVPLEAGRTYGVFVYLASYGSGTSVRYTNGSNVYANDDMTLTSNCGKGNPAFTGSTFASRIWNGTIFYTTGAGTCYADCDGNEVLDFFDFLCFQNSFLAGDPYADCDQNGVLDFFDFLCFQNEFLAGCP
jgi:hypothetical protein